MTEERSSDPFPFLKIHRTVEALAEAVSTGFGIPIEKAGWGLMRFWRRCADPREIEAAFDRGDRWVFLDDETLSRRLLLTFGKDLDHLLLAEAGVVEKVDGKWRVKGTSDFFLIIEESRRSAEAGAKGGRKAAENRKGKGGYSPPTTLPTLPGLETGRGGAAGGTQERRDEREDGKKTDRSIDRPNANHVWEELAVTFEAHGVPIPEIHPADRNNRIHALLRQLNEPTAKLLDQILWVGLEGYESLRNAKNPLAYLQTMLKDPETKATLHRAVELRTEQAA